MGSCSFWHKQRKRKSQAFIFWCGFASWANRPSCKPSDSCWLLVTLTHYYSYPRLSLIHLIVESGSLRWLWWFTRLFAAMVLSASVLASFLYFQSCWHRITLVDCRVIQPIRCRYGEFDRSIDRNLVVEMQSCFSSKGLALSTSIGKHCLPRIIALEIMNNNCMLWVLLF